MTVASFDDLMAHKLKVLLQRLEAKDCQDIAAMVRAGVSVDRGLASAGLLFGRAFQPSEALKAMAYFEGGDLHRLSERDKVTLTTSAAGARHLPVTALAANRLGLDEPDATIPAPWVPGMALALPSDMPRERRAELVTKLREAPNTAIRATLAATREAVNSETTPGPNISRWSQALIEILNVMRDRGLPDSAIPKTKAVRKSSEWGR